MMALVQQKRNLVLTLVKQILSLHYNGDGNSLYVGKVEIYKLKAKDNIISYDFRLGRVSKDFTKD